MSFSSGAKAELCRAKIDKKCCAVAESYGVLLYCNTFTPGEIRIIDPDDIAEMFMMTTHNMPLNYLIDQLKEDIGEVIFLGIQPDIVGFYYPMTQPIKDAVETVYQRLEGWEGNGGFAQLAVEEE